jgi:cell division protein ZapE
LTSDTSPGQLLRQEYETRLAARGYRADAAQRAAVDLLGQWLSAFLGRRRSLLRRPAAGVYLWGGVGRGKSFVMDALYAAAPLAEKRRVHFHGFLAELQTLIRVYAGRPDPLALAARELAGSTRLLCFDEFHVHDIGDAMLLGRLVKVLVEEGVGVVCTSNYPPSKLCPNPLYRERFLPTIKLIDARFEVLELDGGQDYRRESTRDWGEFCWPLADDADWDATPLAPPPHAERDVVLEVNRRPLRLVAREGQRAWLDFAELCRGPRSSADYLWLCAHFAELTVSTVPPMDGEGIDVQQRFLNFIDIAYDSGVRLRLGGVDRPDVLCRAGSHTDFSRTHSRLQQLQALDVATAASLCSFQEAES